MIAGIGVDIVEVARIERAMQDPRFLERILTPGERQTELTPLRVAGRWAVKEAVAKALSISLSWQDVEILNDDLGKPHATIVGLPPFTRVLVSISHEKGHAVGMAIVEQV